MLQRRGLLCRLGRGVPPRDLAGWFVSDDEVDQILRSLPGLDGAPPEARPDIVAALDAHVAAAAARLAVALTDPAQHTDERFRGLVVGAGLQTAAVRLLAVLVAVEINPQRQRLVGYIQDDVTLPRLTVSAVASLGIADGRPDQDGSATLLVGPRAALTATRLVSVDTDGPWARRAVSVAPRVIWHLLGDDTADPGLPPAAVLEPALPAAAMVGRSTGAPEPEPDGPGLLLVHGADRRSRLVRALAEPGCGSHLIVTPPPVDDPTWSALIREAVLTGRTVILETESLDPVAAQRITESPQVSWVLSSREELPLEGLPRRPWREVFVADGRAGDDEWRAALGNQPREGFRLDREQLRLAAAVAPVGAVSVTERVRRVAAGHLDRLAQRLIPSRGWPDLVLPADQTEQLRELVARHRRRGVVYDDWGFAARPSAGLVALFSGSSGTGKTLAAEVIAADLGLDVYKIDLSSVVSKYIGETEKNLGRIFDAAATADLVLFFDEADSLFGKRSEVSDARDRYANIEVSYLLQRLECYDGIVILATNLQRNIDPAFVRRLSVAIDFPMPELIERERIWRGAFPPGAPLLGVDFDFLAQQFQVSGGVIRNAALGAAFLAADGERVITMECVVLALKREFQKAGRLRTAEEFGRYYDLVMTRDGHAQPAR